MSKPNSFRGRLGRQAVAVFILVMATAALDAKTGPRAEGSWCALVQGPDGGYVTCSYFSREQCMMSLSGNGGICHPNPDRGAIQKVQRPR
jgi:Protein of unknown function (DUF3551)